MSDMRKIDRQIAELMGYEFHEGVPGYYVNHDKGGRYDHIPFFTESWNAMRLLVEWLNSKNTLVHVTYHTDRQAAVTLEVNDLELTEYEEAPTAPLALCKAVLALPKEVWMHD